MKEFDFINKLLKPIAGEKSGKLQDDCAFFDGYCITKDILISGIHFFADDPPFKLAQKALRVNLSDLAASGAVPFGFMLGLALPKNTTEEWLKNFTDGLRHDNKHYNFQLLGGDTIMHENPLMIAITAIGKTATPILRKGAAINDNIFVSGKIGDGYLGLLAKQGNSKYDQFIINYELPNPRIELGQKLHGIATSCIDISDGLLADLWHICQESNLGAEIYSKQIPLATNGLLIEQLSGGDDYELLFTSPMEHVDGCYNIGKTIGKRELILDGKPIKPKGYEH